VQNPCFYSLAAICATFFRSGRGGFPLWKTLWKPWSYQRGLRSPATGLARQTRDSLACMRLKTKCLCMATQRHSELFCLQCARIAFPTFAQICSSRITNEYRLSMPLLLGQRLSRSNRIRPKGQRIAALCRIVEPLTRVDASLRRVYSETGG